MIIMGLSVREIVISLYQIEANAYKRFYTYWTFKTHVKLFISVQTRFIRIQEGGIVIDSEGFILYFYFVSV